MLCDFSCRVTKQMQLFSARLALCLSGCSCLKGTHALSIAQARCRSLMWLYPVSQAKNPHWQLESCPDIGVNVFLRILTLLLRLLLMSSQTSGPKASHFIVPCLNFWPGESVSPLGLSQATTFKVNLLYFSDRWEKCLSLSFLDQSFLSIYGHCSWFFQLGLSCLHSLPPSNVMRTWTQTDRFTTTLTVHSVSVR